MQAETHANLQAVTETGASAWTPAFPYTIRGVLLCNPAEMLDPTPQFLPWEEGANQYRMGGEWQITFQAVAEGDRGGTTCWMGQNYGNLPWLRADELNYTNEAWVSEILRLNHDPSTMHAFRAGDLIEITVNQSLSYGGKRNINEGHDIDPASNFEIRLVTADYGLPSVEVIALSDVMQPGGDPDDWTSWPSLFDPTRTTGAEHYQGMRVRINDLNLLSTAGWNATNLWANRLCTVTDGEGRYFSLRHPRYDLGEPPTGVFDAVGIFSQESGSGTQGTNGYELFVQQVLPQQPPSLEIGLQLMVTWPESAMGYQLEWSDTADGGGWAPLTNEVVNIDGHHTVILPPSRPQQFYQLRETN